MKLCIWFRVGSCKIFRDWFDFADYCKQENEGGRVVTIYKWGYL